jgi:hypothetical protein
MTTNIFVFGSNLAGRHGKGAALSAKHTYGALQGEGQGRTGDAYAIPTKGFSLKPLGLTAIKFYVLTFITYAREHPELTFTVTKIGCGLAGYTEDQIKPFFETAPENCQLPEGWRK